MYRPVSTGHAAHEEPRMIEQGTIDERIIKLAERWLTIYPEYWPHEYELACMMTATLHTAGVVAGLLAAHPLLQRHEGYDSLGFFISALWNKRCPEHVFTYPHNTPKLAFLGGCLAAEKVLIHRGVTGIQIGYRANGPVIILGTTERYVGVNAKGPIINPTKKDIVQLPQRRLSKKEYAQNIPLKTYIDQLLILAKEDPAAIETAFGNGIAITAKINELVGGAK